LTLYGTAGGPLLTGEIKLPDRPDGQSPGKVSVAGAGAYFEALKGKIGYLRLFDSKKAASLEQRLLDTCAELGYHFA
jgi:hypothetical protein